MGLQRSGSLRVIGSKNGSVDPLFDLDISSVPRYPPIAPVDSETTPIEGRFEHVPTVVEGGWRLHR